MGQYKLRKFICVGCGSEVEKHRSKNNLKYCSLDCFRKSKRPNRMTGKIIKCNFCSKETYKHKCHLNHKNHFCSLECANNFQRRNKIIFLCKICGKEFKWSKSRLKKHNPLYCSIKCRTQDKEWVRKAYIQGNLVQQQKKGLNKLELQGQKILKEMGLKFNEQVLMFDKFLVDVVLKDKPIIIQWDGIYWHSKPKRKRLDKSQDSYLRKCGYTILRFTDEQIKNKRSEVYDNIRKAIQ